MPALPGVLLVATADGEFAPLIAARIHHSGIAVDALCPGGHLLGLSVKVGRQFRFSHARPGGSIAAAIAATAPALIIACDDEARYNLSRHHAACVRLSTPAAQAASALIERSLGRPEHFSLAEEKSRLLTFLKASDVRCPPTIGISGAEALDAASEQLGFPLVLKRDRTQGGQGVIICRNRADAADGYRKLTAPPALRETLRRVVYHADPWQLAQLLRAPPAAAIAAQGWIEGRPANRAVACWQGEVLAGLTVVAREMDPKPSGPASVVEIIADSDIERMTRQIVRQLGLSGICGFDFVIEVGTGQAYFLELNPRATPTCHLGRTPQSDICGALLEKICGAGPGARPAGEEPRDPDRLVALFPGEWRRDLSSPHLTSAEHGVPWDDPGVITAIALARFHQMARHRRGLLANLLARIASRVLLRR